MNRRRRQNAVRLTILLVAGLVACACFALWPHDRLLLARATRIMDLPSDDGYYQWLSDHELLVWHTRDSSTLEYSDRQVDHLSVYDTTTHHLIRDAVLEKQIQTTGGRAASIAVSPNGKRLLWISLQTLAHHRPDEDGDAYFVYCSTLDGRVLARTRIGDFTYHHKGYPDSFGWAGGGEQWWETIPIEGDEEGADTRLCVRTVGAPRKTAMLSFASGYPLGDYYDDFQLTGGRLIVCRGLAGGDNGLAAVYEYRVGSKLEWLKGHNVPAIPEQDGAPLKSALSVNGAKICLQVGRVEPPSQIARWLHRLLPVVPATARKTADIYVYNINSRRLKEIGMAPRVAPDYHAPLSQLRWAPDNRRISFVYKSALYTVPVD